jgi:myo-inositol-1(or 4)-monophosphatase
LPEPEEDLNLLEACVREAGTIALKYFGGDYKRWSKSGGSPVTEADLAIDAFLKAELCGARPDYAWLSEESHDDPARLGAARVFVVDPIDGTVAFMKGRPHFTICAALVENTRPVAGVVYNPAAGECFSARQGGGAMLNGETIQVGTRTKIAGCRLLADKTLFQDWPPMHIESFSSIAYRVALVAAARFDAMVSLTNKHDWDLAAADVILAEAGGGLVDAGGKPLAYNRSRAVQGATIAAGPGLIAPLLAELAAKNSLKPPADSP